MSAMMIGALALLLLIILIFLHVPVAVAMAVVGLAALQSEKLAQLDRMQHLVYALSLEGLNGNVSPILADNVAAKGFPAGIQSAKTVREHLAGSYLWQRDDNRAVQDPLSFRDGVWILSALSEARSVPPTNSPSSSTTATTTRPSLPTPARRTNNPKPCAATSQAVARSSPRRTSTRHRGCSTTKARPWRLPTTPTPPCSASSN